MARKLLDRYGDSGPAEGKPGKRESLMVESGIDPNLLAMLAKKKKQGQMTERTKKVPQREPSGSALSPKGKPIDPRQRAAMLMQQKIQSNMEESSGQKKKKKKKVPNPNV